ncbi:MAG TPA: DUF4349 domain-containing protein [Acidimicrobiales bacterium]|nr:DUF4349 domain-containing protein [Acidimicrobiales bacterium]
MPRTRTLVGATLALVVAAGAAVAATTSVSNPSASVGASQEPQSPQRGGLTSGEAFDAGAPRPSAAAGAGALAPASGTVAVGSARAANVPASGGPRIVKTASMNITVRKAIDAATDRIPGIAARFGGFVSESQRRGHGRELDASFTIRIPAAQFDSARTELARLGDVRGESLGGRDVSGQLVDFEARLRSMRAEEEALRAILSKATTVGDTLQVTQSLAEVRSRIEQLDAQRAQLADAADLATINVTVVGPAAVSVSPDAESVLERSVSRALGAALAIVGGTVVALGAAVPLVVLGALFLIAARAVGRRRQRAVEAAVG